MTKKLTYVANRVSADDSQHWVHIPNLLHEMEKLGWEIDLVSERGGSGTATVLGLPVTFLSESSRVSRVCSLVRHLIRGGSRNRVVFVRISKSAGLVAGALGRLLGWKTVYWLSDVVVDFNAKRLGWRAPFEYYMMWTMFRLVDRLVTGPERIVDYFMREYRLPKQKVALLYNDLDLNGIAPAKAHTGSAIRVLMVHWLSPRRDTIRYFPALLAALERQAEKGASVQLDVIGGGPEQPLLEHYASENPGKVGVTFHGPMPNRELDEFYRSATIFVMPSYREGFARVLLEAMARGLPIVSTDAGGTRDVLGEDQQPYVVDRDDSGGFGMAVERLLSSPADQRRLAAENLRTVKRFSTPQVARMYDRALSSLIGASAAS
jgi:glycosyltransferase involved in cell wall biosynthesis